MSKDTLILELDKLVLLIKKTVDNQLSKGEIIQDQAIYFKWVIDKFDYTGTGAVNTSAHGENIIKKVWFSALEKIFNEVKISPIYCSTLTELKNLFKNTKEDKLMGQELDSFVRASLSHYLTTKQTNKDNLIKIFIKDLYEEPLGCWAKIYVDGLILKDDLIKPTHNITIRKPKKEDLELEYPINSYIHPNFEPFPSSAIIELKSLLKGTEAGKLQEEVEKAICLLRLFNVGSIVWSKYSMGSKSLTGFFGGNLISHKDKSVLERYELSKIGETKITNFFKIIEPLLPKNLFSHLHNQPDFISVIYNRYCDALLKNGTVERRIANIIMGLEAIFLTSEEKQELRYKLSLRVAKFMGLIGYDDKEIIKMVKDAYDIRSVYSHGGFLKYKSITKYNRRHGDINKITTNLLNYLRLSLIAVILFNKEKDEFVDILDQSLISDEKGKFITDYFSRWKDILK